MTAALLVAVACTHSSTLPMRPLSGTTMRPRLVFLRGGTLGPRLSMGKEGRWLRRLPSPPRLMSKWLRGSCVH